MRILLILAFLVTAARPAAACSHPYFTIFEAFDTASIVVHARVRAPGGKLALSVITTLKGKPPATIDLGLGHARSMCAPSHLRGNGIAFLTDKNGFAVSTQSFITDDKAALAALAAYAKATTPAARAAVLVEQALTNMRRAVRIDASLALADDPVALAAVTAADRDRMLAALPKADDGSRLGIALARLGVAESKLTGDAATLAKHHTFEAITKPAELADIIAATPDGPSPRAIAAFERCERLRGKRLMRIDDQIYAMKEEGLAWKVLAADCKN